MLSLRQDIHFALRQIRRRPGFAAIAVLTLGLGIGATTAIFGVVNAVMLQPLDLPEPDRLVRIWETTPEGSDFSASDPNYLNFREQNRSFLELAAYRQAALNMTGKGEPTRVEAMAVTHTLFPLLGASPAIGRTFTADEDRVGGNTQVIVLGHALWQRHFGGSPAALGSDLLLDGHSFTVVGVMPEGFDFPGAEAWIPLAPDPSGDRGNHWLDVIGRLRPGVSIEQASADLGSIAERIGAEHPHIAGWGVRLASFSDWIVGEEFRRTALILLAAVGFLLLIACANVANLLIARASTRQVEIGVRTAMGASRGRLAAQLLTESMVLGLLGSAVGLALAYWAIEALQLVNPASIPRLEEVAIDTRVLTFAIAAGLVTSLLFGIAPALHATRIAPAEAVKHGGRTGSQRSRIRDGLVVTQVALAVLLLVGAGLMLQSYTRLQQVDLGFQPENVLAAPLELSDDGFAEPWQKVVFLANLAERLEGAPGISAVGATAIDPFSEWNLVNDVTPAERAAEVGSAGLMQAGWRVVTPGFFGTMGVPLIHGRLFSASDAWDGPRNVIVSATLAERMWPGEDAVGKELYWGGTTGQTRRVIGVVGDYQDVQVGADPPPLLFIPYNQLPWPMMTLLVRIEPGVTGAATTVRREIWAEAPNLAIPQIQPLVEQRADAIAGPRFNALLLSSFGLIALLLAAVGIYGVMAFNVAQRTREFGIRIALGADAGGMMRLVLLRAAALCGAGVVLGMVAALVLTRLMTAILYDTAPTDPLAYLVVGAVLGAITLAASFVPAIRVTRVDPSEALRAE